ncbi:MAG: GntP family permease [Oscillospiraceae bacterium]|nr:GntP family permease [Oscillospiraceae bacterium]
MSTTIGILSIIVAFAALIVLTYKGMSVMYVAPVCALFVAIVNRIPILDAIAGPFLGGTTGFISGLLPIFLLSILMGRVYVESGAAVNIARTLMRVFAGKAKSQKTKQTIAVYICIAVSWAMCFGGIDTFCALFTLFPVMLTICAEANIPRKYLIGLITCGVSTAALTPGAPLVTNYTPMNILGTSSAAGLIPGLAAVLVMLLGGGIYLSRSIHRASARGEVFEPGNVPFTPPSDDRKYPPFLVALLPLIAVVILFNVVNNLIVALALGFVLSLVLLVPFFEKTEDCSRGKKLINTLNEGGRSTAESLFMGAIVVGFASVVQATPAYEVMVNGLLGLRIPAPLLVVIAVAILVGLTGSPPAGLAIVVPVLAANLNLAPEAIHRIATTAATTFDTLPFQGAILIMLSMADLKHKDGYPPVMMCTVVWTLAASVVAAILFAIFPGLA